MSHTKPKAPIDSAPSPLARLVAVMARLRDPKNGCPWDLEQDFRSIAPHTLEETYEVVEAMEKGDPTAMLDELGDLLFQIVFYAQMGREKGMFDLDQIAAHVADKMIERHPHVFGDREANTAQAVLTNWEADKAKKREAKAGTELSALDGISSALPAALRALKLQKRAARVGFDWTDPKDIFDKLREEAAELEVEIKAGNTVAIEDELGDLMFVLINLARRLDVEPEQALRGTNRKFERRFRELENRLAGKGKKPADTPLDEMERIWVEIKMEEKKSRKGPA